MLLTAFFFEMKRGSNTLYIRKKEWKKGEEAKLVKAILVALPRHLNLVTNDGVYLFRKSCSGTRPRGSTCYKIRLDHHDVSFFFFLSFSFFLSLSLSSLTLF